MAKTLAQLQKEYADITEKNRDAYDRLNGKGQYRRGISGSLYDQWQNALSKGPEFKADAAKLKAAYDEAQAAYKKTQETKNALKKELAAAETAEKKAKEEGASKKSAQSNYDKALAGLKQAQAAIGGYNGEKDYIAAYQKAQAAAGELTKAGGTPQLPALVSGVNLPKTNADGTPVADGAKGKELTLKQQVDFLTDPKNEDILAKWQTALKNNFGYKGKTDGSPDPTFAAALSSAYASRSSQPTAWQRASAEDFIFNPPFTLSSSGTASGVGGTTNRSYTVIFNKTQAESAINDLVKSELGRDATANEIKVLTDQLVAAQKSNPTKYQVTTDASGNTLKSIQTGGIDATQWLTDKLKNGADGKLPALKDEYAKVKIQAPEVTKLQANKKLYEAALGKAGTDLGAQQAVKDTTAYGRGLKELNTQIADYVLNAGATNTPDEIATLAADLYDKGYDLSSETGVSQLQGFLKFGPSEGGTYTGKAGTVVADLAKTAMANGLDLNKTFGNKLQDWISSINKGEPIDNIKQQIREIAKIGMPDNIKKLIDNGVDLQDIYSPYKNTMASVLELSPDSIDLSDPTLRAAITNQGEVPLYDFERALRKDDRWQYTNQARSEVSGAAQKILQDFGFMG